MSKVNINNYSKAPAATSCFKFSENKWLSASYLQ